MISVFNRAELFVDVSQEAAAKVWSTLKENGIEYEMTTKQDVSAFRKNIHYAQGMSSTMASAPSSVLWRHSELRLQNIREEKRPGEGKELCSL